jgi:hypothetical protein
MNMEFFSGSKNWRLVTFLDRFADKEKVHGMEIYVSISLATS